MQEIKVAGVSVKRYKARGVGLIAMTATGGYLTAYGKTGWGNSETMVLGETKSLDQAFLFTPNFKLAAANIKELPPVVFLEAEEQVTRTVTLKIGE